MDGSASKLGSGAGLVIIPYVGDKMEYAVKFDFFASNNEAEYEALILGLQICITARAQNILVKSDSQLIVGQVSGEYEAKEDNMKMYLNKTRELIKKLTSFHIQHFPRFENQQADALARMASSAEGLAPRSIIWEVLNQPSINSLQVHILNRTDTWIEELIGYLRDGLLPMDEKEVEALKRRAEWFIWHEGHLYNKSYTHPMLKCITPFEGNYILREIHEGAWSSHQGARTIAGKALRAGYYWPTLRQYVLVKKCRICQLHGDIPRPRLIL